MSRGPGMTIDEDKAAVQPTGIGTGQVRSFSADLPNFDNSAQINAGAKIQNLGEELMQITGQKAAKEAAESVVLEKDPQTGEYKRPETPWMGLLSAQTYDKVVDQRFVENVYRDFEKQADVIAAQHFNDPDTAGAKMNALMQGTLKAVPDQRLGNLISPLLQREVSERQRGILGYRAKHDYENEVKHLATFQEEAMDKAQSYAAAGDMDAAKRWTEIAHNASTRMAEVGAIDERMVGSLDRKQHGVIQAAVVERQFAQLADNDKLTEDDVERVQAMLRGHARTDDNVYGMTQKDLLEALPDQQSRDQLASRLGKIKQDYFDRKSARIAAGGPLSIDEHYAKAPRSGEIPELGGDKGYAAWLGWAVQKSASNDPLDPAVARKMFEMTGVFPKTYYGKVFENPQAKSPEELVKLAGIYKQMQAATNSAGDVIAAMPESAMSPTSAAWMRLYTRELENTGDPVGAAKAANDLWDRGLNTLDEAKDPGAFVAREMKKRDPINGGSWDRDKLRTSLRAFLPDKGVGLNWEQESQIQQLVAVNLATNATPDDAIKGAIATFQASHKQSPFVVTPGGTKNGWVANHYADWESADPRNGGSTADWVPEAVNPIWNIGVTRDPKTGKETGPRTLGTPRTVKERVLNPGQTDALGNTTGGAEFTEKEVTTSEPADPLIPRKQGNITIKEPPKLGVNMRYLPVENSTKDPAYVMLYSPGEGQHDIVLRDYAGRAVTVRLGKAVEAQRAAAQDALGRKEWQRGFTDYERNLGGWGGGDTRKTEVTSPLATHIDPRDLVDSIDLGVTMAPVPGGATQGGRGRSAPELKPARNDNLPSPLTPMSQPGSTLQPSSELYNLVNVRRNPNVRLEGMSEPLAGGLSAMIAAMPKEVRAEFTISSGVRTREQQEVIYATSRPGYAARPGHSLHEKGNAADLHMGPAAMTWVHLNAGKFGLHFPLNGRNGMPDEPWHIEPVGARGRRAEADTGDSEHLV